MEHSPRCKAVSCSVSQQIPDFFEPKKFIILLKIKSRN